MSTLDVTEAAAMLKMKPTVLTRWARSGRVPAARPGRAWVFVEDDLLAWLRGQYKQENPRPSIVAKVPTPGTTRSGPASGASSGLDMSLLATRPMQAFGR